MPANRSRTLEWRRCLQQVHERDGSLEIAVAGVPTTASNDGSVVDAQSHLLWRVRLLSLTEHDILVEQPTTLGQVIDIERGIGLIVILSIGQNRWTFRTTCKGAMTLPASDRRGMSGGGGIAALRLSMPESVTRCQRRNHYRVETPLTLPRIDVWPLLDGRSVIPAERAHEIQFEIDMGRLVGQLDSLRMDFDSVMPEVGAPFTATLLNLGGGGMGLRVEPQDAVALARHKVFWLRFNLPPALKTPICATGKLVHTHMESNHDTYAGMAFDFSFNPSHQKFVVDQICRYIATQQREQTMAANGQAQPQRRTA